MAKTEHPAVMMERLLQEKHNLILDNEKLRAALRMIADARDDGDFRMGSDEMMQIAQKALGA